MDKHKPIRILVVDDHYMVRAELAAFIRDYPKLTLAGEASTGEQAIERYRDLAPDVVLMDLSMPGMGGMEATRIICMEDPQARVIILTSERNDSLVQKAWVAGARGYFEKGVNLEVLGNAIQMVNAGQSLSIDSY